MITAKMTDCENDWAEITDSCINNHPYYYPTFGIQTWSYSDFPKMSWYSSISVTIKANTKNLIVTPHCISFKYNMNASSIDNLINKWMSESIPWPLHHSQGNIVTFNHENISQFINFTEPCYIKKNRINAVILIFSHNFNAYHIETTSCNKMDGITMYDHLITNKNDENCSLSIKTNNNWNIQLLPTINSDLLTPIKDENGKINAILTYIVYTLTLLLLCNAIWCILMCCYNQKKLKQLKSAQNTNVNTSYSSQSKPATIISLYPPSDDLEEMNSNKLRKLQTITPLYVQTAYPSNVAVAGKDGKTPLFLDTPQNENGERQWSLSSFPTIPNLNSVPTDNLDGFIFINDNYSKDNQPNNQCASNIIDVDMNMNGDDNDNHNKLQVVCINNLNTSTLSTINDKNNTSNDSSMSSFILTPINKQYEPNLSTAQIPQYQIPEKHANLIISITPSTPSKIST